MPSAPWETPAADTVAPWESPETEPATPWESQPTAEAATAPIPTDEGSDWLGVGEEVRGFGRSLNRGGRQFAQSWDVNAIRRFNSIPGDIQKADEEISYADSFLTGQRQHPGTADTASVSEIDFADYTRQMYSLKARATRSKLEWQKELERLKTAAPAAAEDFARQQQAIEQLPQSAAQQEFQAEETPWYHFFKNPVELSTLTLAESAPVMAQTMAAAPAGPVGVAAVAGVGSFNAESSARVINAMAEAKVNLKDPSAVMAWFADRAKSDPELAKADLAALGPASFDALTGGLAGKFLGPAIGKGLRPVLTATGKEMGVQMAGGGAGSIAGSVLAGEEIDPKDITLEIAGEWAPGEAVSNVRADRSRRVSAITPVAPPATVTDGPAPVLPMPMQIEPVPGQRFIFDQNGREVVYTGVTEDQAKELAFRQNPGATFVRAETENVPAAIVAPSRETGPAAAGPVTPSEQSIEYAPWEIEGGSPGTSEQEDATVDYPYSADDVAIEPLTTTRLAPDGRKVVAVEMPVNEIEVDPVLVPQFKNDADETSGEVRGEELKAARYERPSNPIVVWQLNNGRNVVVTGRHRFALAKRLGEKTIPATIVREADGFTRQYAITLDAEFNIRDGNGSVDDYANYIENTPKLTEQEARARGLLDRAKGEAAWHLARSASNDLRALYKAGKIAEREAVAIASAAPGNAAAQAIGSKFALAGKSAAFIRNVIQASQAEAGQRATSLDLFGNDDAAMQEMEAQADRASQFQREISEQVRAVQGAAKRPDVARKLGVDVQDPAAITLKIVELKNELARWQNWPLHPDLVAKAKGLPPGAQMSLASNVAEIDRKINQLRERQENGGRLSVDEEAQLRRLETARGQQDLLTQPVDSKENRDRRAAELRGQASELFKRANMEQQRGWNSVHRQEEYLKGAQAYRAEGKRLTELADKLDGGVRPETLQLEEAPKPKESPQLTLFSVNSPAAPDSATADVRAIADQEAGDAPMRVLHDATLLHNGQMVEGYLDPATGQIVLNAAAPTMRDPANVRRVVREERAHWLLATPEGQAELRKFAGQLTPAQRAELQRQGYTRQKGESAETYEARLHNEFIAKQARENTKWWQNLVDKVRAWLAANGLAKLTNEETARAILRRLNTGQAERQLAHGYLRASNAVLTAPWARVKDILTSLTAHHGTPHKVDKFTTAKIGTGEGAQVYGWGLYFAEAEAVADVYSRLGDTHSRVFDGQQFDPKNAKHQAAFELDRNGGDIRRARQSLEDQIPHRTEAGQRVMREAIAALDSGKFARIDQLKSSGNKYTVTVNVEPEDLLDWDKPLSEQSEKVKAGVRNAFVERGMPVDKSGKPLALERNPDGQSIQAWLSGAKPERVASELMAKLGIKGIRYLDQGSRVPAQGWVAKHPQGGELVFNFKKDAEAYISKNPEYRLVAPKQTYNYVIFDENDITITHENGQPVSAGQLMPQFSLAPVTPVSPAAQTQIAVIEQQAGNVNESPASPTLVTSPELRGKFRDMVGTVSGKIVYYGGQLLLKAKRGLDLTAAYQAAAVKAQSDALLNQLFSSAYTAQGGFKLPQWMKVGAWASRTRAFKKRLLHVVARLNATGRHPDGTFKFDDFQMRAGMMSLAAFKVGKHTIGDTFMHVDPDTGVQEELEIGPLIVVSDDGRTGYQIFRSLNGQTQAELYRTMQESFPELIWLLDMFIDPALANVRQTINGIQIPVFNRFAQAAMMAEANPNFTPLTGYTPDVLVSRSLMGAIRGALSFSQGTRSPGRKYKFGTSRESGYVRDLLTGFNVRTFQMLQEQARRQWRAEVFKAASAIPKTGVPQGWVKLETGMEDLWQAVKRLRHWTSPESWKDITKRVEEEGLDAIEEDLKEGESIKSKNGRFYLAKKIYPETEARLSSRGDVNQYDERDFEKFFWETKSLRGKQLMLPQPLVDSLLKRYVVQREHGALYRLGAWAVRNSTQLFLVAPKTYVANVLTNDLFAIEAGTRYALHGLAARDATSLRFSKELFAGIFTNRFAAFRQGTGLFAGSDYMQAIRESLPEEIFADSTSLADVKVRWGNSALDYLRQGEIGAAALQMIQYGSIDTRAKQRMSFAFLKATAVSNARRAGLKDKALKLAVDRYLAKPPQADRVRAVEIANFELLNYADSPQLLNDIAENDYSRLLLPFPRFGYHYVTKQLKRVSAARLFLGKVPKGKRAEAFADLVTFSLFPLGGAGIAALLAAGLGDDDEEKDARELVGTSSVVQVNPDGSVTRMPIDREFITANRLNISAWARAMGIESENEDDFWLRVRNYPTVAAAGVTALAYNDARKHGVKAGAQQFARSAGDLASDFFSVGAALKVPFKIAADLQSDQPQRTVFDPFAQNVPLSFYITEQLTDSFIPGSRQADELLAWVNPVRSRRTTSKTLDYDPGPVEALAASHWTGLLNALARGGESGLPAAGTIDRRTASVPNPSTLSLTERISSLGGVNLKQLNRADYEQAINPK